MGAPESLVGLLVGLSMGCFMGQSLGLFLGLFDGVMEALLAGVTCFSGEPWLGLREARAGRTGDVLSTTRLERWMKPRMYSRLGLSSSW